MLRKLFEEIKHPYTKKNRSYALFKYGCLLLVSYFLFSFSANAIAFGFLMRGNASRAIHIVNNDIWGIFVLGSLAIVCFLISVIGRKKI